MRTKKKSYYRNNKVCMNGADRIRTDDLLHAMQALSQLSYSPALNIELYHKISRLARGKETKINIF